MKEETKYFLIFLSLILVYDLLFTLPPVLLHFGLSADLIYRFFQPVCDQLDSRSFHIFGYKLAVCSRCASIYYGAALGTIIYPLFRPLRDTRLPNPLLAGVPLAAMIADFSINYIGIGHNTFLSRSITGGVFGLSLAFFIVPVWIAFIKEMKTKRRLQHEE